MQEQSKVLTKKIHIFDICGTLYKSNTTYDFLYYYFKRNNQYKYFIFRCLLSLPAKVIWRFLGLLGLSYYIRTFLLSFLKHEPVQLIQNEAQIFVEDFLQPKIIVDMVEKLERVLNKSDDVHLVSASIYPVVEAIANKLKVSSFKATKLEVFNNRYTGKISIELEKRKKSVICQMDLDLSQKQIFVYTDSFNDSDIVEISDVALIVCKKEKKNNWLNKFPNKKIKFCHV